MVRKRLNLGYVLKAKPAGFADKLDIGSERQIKDSFKNFDRNWLIGNFETGTRAGGRMRCGLAAGVKGSVS